MLSALISFLGGSAFRMIWGEVSSWINKKQDHAHELERLQLQDQLDDKAHARNLENLRLQADLGVKQVEIQRDADIQRLETDAWAELVKGTTRATGIRFVDAWNAVIRPMLATLAIFVVIAQIVHNGFVLSDWDKELVAAILGIFLADRQLMKRGK